VNDLEIIENELRAFSEDLARKPVIVVATKLDATTNRERLENLRAYCIGRGLLFYAISSASGEGIPQLVLAMADALDRIPRPASAPAIDDLPGDLPAEAAAETPDFSAAGGPHDSEPHLGGLSRDSSEDR